MRYLLANWKMYPTLDEGRALLGAVQAGLRARLDAGATLPTVIVCPPSTALVALRAMADGRAVRLGAQNCHWDQEGPYTGEVSPTMLEGVADYVMVGHSERRRMGETDHDVARKVAAVAGAGMVPILFVGEDAPGGDAVGIAEQRLRAGLARVDPASAPVLVVYEPSWAIGAAAAAAAGDVRRAVRHLKGVLAAMGSPRAEVLYGGSVSPAAFADLGAVAELDGVGATRASLDPEAFLRLVDLAAATAPGATCGSR